jgi:Uncharacterized membrane protein
MSMIRNEAANLWSFLVNTNSSINGAEVILNIVLASLMSGVIYMVFINFGNTFSNRKQFGYIFMLITVCTTMIVSIVAASIALSLGLVGALSIVRFRTAIKEPEELAYTFFCITVGLGLGANQRVLTLISTGIILMIIILRGLFTKNRVGTDTYNFSIISAKLTIEEMLAVLKKYSKNASLRRYDRNTSLVNAQFIVDFKNATDLENAVNALAKGDSDVSTSFISHSTFM